MQKARVVIHYCTLCQWQLRAAWLAQELLQSFTDSLFEVALRPGEGGIFEVWANETRIWCRKADGGFPDAKTLKQRFHAAVSPETPLPNHLRHKEP